MPITRIDHLPSISIHPEGENIAIGRSKLNSIASSGKVAASHLRPRAVLGDLGNNKTGHVNTIHKSEHVSESDFKKPSILPSKHVKPAETAELTQKVEDFKIAEHKEVEVAKAFSTKILNVPDIDTDTDNPQLVACYVKDIYKYLYELEASAPIKPNYMEGYKIRPSMRAILVDWLVDVHGRFKLLQETLFMTVAIMDQFLQVDSTVTRQELQLVGLTAMFIASKFEEMYAPEIQDFVYMSDKAYTKKDILRMELRILKSLDFQMGRPLPLHFLRRFTKSASHVSDEVDVLHHTLSKYLMELTLPEYEFSHYPPSQLAAAALCLSLKILDESNIPVNVLWNDTLIFYSGYTFEVLEPIVEKLCSLIIKSETNKQQAVRKKYASSKFYNISTLHHLKGPYVKLCAKMALKN